ncbi:MAG: hypothetical protein QCI38_08070, partial [Candidatus Thermoplasmatota archaeon]|nr:hypothetical protein [Candidatus Thermoplasmatota archaeon]
LKEEDHPYIFHPLWEYVKADTRHNTTRNDMKQYNTEHGNHPTTLYCPKCDKTYPRNKIRHTPRLQYSGPTAAIHNTDLCCGKGHILYRKEDWVA